VLAPSDEALQNLLGSAYLGKGDREAALVHLQKAFAGNPADALALFLRAQIYADRNENEKALGDAEKVVARHSRTILKAKGCSPSCSSG
jgi:Tfp pilus assembly protein PilF